MYSKTNNKEPSFSCCSPFFSLPPCLILNTSYTNNIFLESVCYFHSTPIQDNLRVFWLILTYQTLWLTQIFLHCLLATCRSSCGLLLYHGQFIILFINHLCCCPLTKFHKSEFQQSNHSIHNYVYWVLIPFQFFFHTTVDLCPSYKTTQHFIWLSQFMLCFQIFSFCFQSSIFVKPLFFSQHSRGYNSALEKSLKSQAGLPPS